MRLLLLPLVMVLACRPTEMDYPVGGGGGGGGGGTFSIDASTDGSGSGDIAGTVCVLTDPRDITTCRTSGSAGLTVTLGTAMATTADDGTFTIARPTTAADWDVTGSTVVQSVSAFTGQTKISAMDSAMFSDLENINGQQHVSGTGALLVRIIHGGTPVQGEVARLTPGAAYDPLYDPATAFEPWVTTATGPLGTVFIGGASTGTAALDVSTGGTPQLTISGIPITVDGVTFLTAALP